MRPLLALGGLVIFVALLPGCSNNSGDTRVKLAFVSNNNYDFWNIVESGCQQAAKDFDVRVEFRKPSRGSAEEQRQIIEDLLNKGIKGIAVSPNDPTNTAGFYKAQVNNRVPLVMADNDLPDPAARRCFVGTNNYVAGQAVGAEVVKALPKGGKIAIFVGTLDSPNARERRQGVLDYLANPKTTQKELGEVTPGDAAGVKFGEYVLVTTRTDDAKAEECQARCREVLLKSPDIDCLIGLWEYNPPALLRAVRESSLKAKPVVVGFDENYQTLDGVKTGEVFSTIVQNPYEFGYQSMKILAGLAKGDESALKGRSDVDDKGRIYVPHRVIDKTNVDEFYTKLKKLKGS